MASTAAVALCGLTSPAAAALPAVFAAVPGNPANRLASLPMDDYRYDRADRCRRAPQAGTLALQAWLQRNAGGLSWGIMRCEKLGPKNFSLHAEGRALDWHLDARKPLERREAERLIALLLAPDRLDMPHALARRMGIQEIIWNCHSWWSGSPAMGRYSACYDEDGERRRRIDDSTAHRNHIHFGLSRLGARMRTSLWASTKTSP